MAGDNVEKSMRRPVGSAILLLFLLLPCVVWAERYVPRIIFGEVAEDGMSPVVEVRRSTVDGTSLCSGVVVANTAVLTAWHCVSKNANVMTVKVGGRKLRVRSVSIHPNARRGSSGALYNDVAILRTRSSIAVPPVSLLVSREVEVGDQLTIHGYGLDEFGDVGTLRRGWTAVDRVNKSFLVAVFSPYESDSCSGDSGGPAIDSYLDSTGRLRTGVVGITSTGTSRNCRYGDQTFYVNLQTRGVKSWIVKTVPQVGLE